MKGAATQLFRRLVVPLRPTMDPSIEYVQQLQQNVAELHQMGRQWGMTEEEMSDCIERVLKESENVVVAPSRKSTARRIWRCFGYIPVVFSFLVVAVIFLVLGTALLFYVYPSAEHYVSGKLQPYGYAIFRRIRLATLPLHRYFNISSLYDSECIFNNPWFEEPTFECSWCENVKDVESLNDTQDQDLIGDFMRQARPVIFKNLAKEVSFEDIRQWYIQNQDVLDKSAFFQSNIEGMTNLRDLFQDSIDENILLKDGTTIHWLTRNMAASQVVRKLFPRPGFIPPESEVALEKVVFIDGHKSDHYELVGVILQMGYYMQVSGNRKVIITPVKHCRNICSPMHAMLQEKDIIMYNPSIWKVVVMPNFKKKLSIGFMGSFSFSNLMHDPVEEIQPDAEDQPWTSGDGEEKGMEEAR